MYQKNGIKRHWLRSILIILGAVVLILVIIVGGTVMRYTPKKYTVEAKTEIIQTEYGSVRGEVLNNNTSRWLGIPYAAAPVGDLRYKAPKAHLGWTNTLETVNKSKDPMQAAALTEGGNCSEDCLYLNIYKPKTEEKELPVLVFIYGGSYDSGSSSIYNFETMAKETGAIIVCFNYRVGPFGFLNFAELSDQFDDNLGLKDIIFALQWINQNIEAFGGNPDNVTIWGQSAGAGAVAVMLQNQEARTYFQKAIIMSNCWESYYTEEQSRILRDHFLEAAGLTQDNIEKLLDMSSEAILQAAGSLEGFGEFGATLFRPVADGEIFSEAPLQADIAEIDIPVLIGTTDNEATMFLNFFSDADIKATLEADIKILYNVDSEKQAEIFSNYDGYPSKDAAVDIVTDLVYKLPASRYADKYSEKAPVWFYRYDAYPFPLGVIGLKSFHACDLMMLCGMLPTEKAGQTFTKYIANFLYDGDPNGDDLPLWNQYTEEDRNVLVIDKRTEEVRNPYRDKLKLYDGIEYLLVKDK